MVKLPLSALLRYTSTVCLCLILVLSWTNPTTPAGVSDWPSKQAGVSKFPVVPRGSGARLADSYGKLPLTFELNNGQTDPQVKFLSRGHGYVLFLTSDGAVLGLQNNNPPGRGENMKEANAPASSHPGGTQNLVSTTLRMKLVNANRALRISGLEPQPGRSNYLRGNDPAKWRTQIANYSRVRYQDAYPGIDLIYYGNPQQLEYDFVVSPGADPRAITLNFATDDETARSHGAVPLRLDRNGDLIASLGDSEVRLLRPVVYQLDLPTPRQTTEQAVAPALRNAVDAHWILKDKGEVGFGIGAYDPKRPLIIDPALNYSTYLSGSSASNAYSVAVDSSGNAYVTGSTLSTDFPTRTPFQNTNHGKYDAFVAKLNSTGTGLVYSTYLGGHGTDYAFGIAVDAAGSAYVAGTTGSSDFPTTVGAFQPKCGGSGTACKGVADAFVTKLDPNGSVLSYSTYLGGTGDDRGYAIALDRAGNAYVTGKTSSQDFPTTPGSFQTTLKGTTNVFVAALNSTGSGLVYSTYLGGSASDQANAIAVDASGDAYVAGSTTSADFPTTPGAFQTSRLGPANAFVTQVNATGNALQYSTYLGGSNTDVAWGIKVDASGNAVAVGQTLSADFPTTPGAFQTTCGGGCLTNNAFVTEINATGSTLNYSTFLGGSAEQEAFAVALERAAGGYDVEHREIERHDRHGCNRWPFSN
jgi:Beta-propeller repeat